MAFYGEVTELAGVSKVDLKVRGFMPFPVCSLCFLVVSEDRSFQVPATAPMAAACG